MEDLPNLVAKLPIWLQYALAGIVMVGSLIPFLLTLYRFPKWIMFKLWPNRERWVAECLPARANEPYYGDRHLNPRLAFDKRLGLARWSQMRGMRKGDYFSLNIGKSRILSRIEFRTEYSDGRDCRYPKEYLLQVQQDDKGSLHDCGTFDGPIRIQFDKPQPIYAMKVVILEPQPEDKGFPAWSIYDIQLTEVRLLGRWWRKEIARRRCTCKIGSIPQATFLSSALSAI